MENVRKNVVSFEYIKKLFIKVLGFTFNLYLISYSLVLVQFEFNSSSILKNSFVNRISVLIRF